MSVFRNYDPKSKQWRPVGSADATTVYSGNPVLTGEGTQSVEDILLKDRNDIELLKKNVSWLAKHGGGGGYGGGSMTKATVQILSPVDNTTPVDSIIWKDSIQFIRIKIVSSYTGTYRLIVRVNGKNVYEQQSVKRNTIVDVPTSVMGMGKSSATIEALAYDDAEMEYTATCKVSVATVELQKPVAVTLTQNQLLNSKPVVTLTYRTTIPGNYRMYYSNSMITYDPVNGWKDSDGALDGNGRTQYVDMIGVGTTVSNLNIPLTDVRGDGSSQIIEPNASPGVYSRYYVMVSGSDPTICSSVVSGQINVTVTNGILISPQFGTDENEPYMISLDGILNLQFITYSKLVGSYSYSIWHGSQQITKTYTDQIYGNIINENIAMNSVFDKAGRYELTIKATGLGASDEKVVYLNVVEASAELLKAYKQDISTSTIFDYTFWDNMKNIDEEAIYINPKFYYANEGKYKELKQRIAFKNRGADSGNKTKVYYEMNHTCVAEIDSYNKRWFPAASSDVSSLIPGAAYQFTLSLAYRIGKEVDDKATIFNLGNYQPVSLGGDGSGDGFLICAHGFYIKMGGTVLEGELSDNTFTTVDIVLKPRTINGTHVGQYVLCVYQDGVLAGATIMSFTSDGSGVTAYSLSGFNTATVGCRSIRDGGGFYATDNSIDMDLYSVTLYSTPLNDGQIICNYINNRANYERLGEGGALDPNLIFKLLSNNSIRPDSEVPALTDINTGEIMKDDNGKPMYNTEKICDIFNMQTGLYDWGVRVENNDVILGSALTNLPIPVVVIDAYNWEYDKHFIKGEAGTAEWDAHIRYTVGGKTIECDIKLSLQGTTTMEYAVKNLDITFVNATFSPKDTWFPEQSFTLKADIVDSGHMNNAVIGTFVNKCLNESTLINKDAFPVAAKIQEYRRSNGNQMPDTMTLKACIEGFPIVLVMSFLSASGESRESRVMGIYSFNLGRKSYINQGFEVLKCLRDTTGNLINADTISYPSLFGIPNSNDKDSTYNAYCYEGSRSINCSTTKDDEIDINDSSAFYDYAKIKVGNTGTSSDWIWLPNVTNKGGYVYYLKESIKDQDNIPVIWNKDNVKKYALIPDGYFWSNHESYSSSLLWKPIYEGINTTQARLEFQKLNNCIAEKLQYVKGLYINDTGKVGTAIRTYNSAIQQYEITSGAGEAWETSPVNGVKFNLTVPQAREEIELSVKNASFYYIICMLFGLVDSFGKNMQMKNWAPVTGNYQPRWSPTFYDMDTALGIDNMGGQSVKPTVFDESIINTPNDKVAFMYSSAPQATNGIFTVYSNKMWGGLDNEMLQRQYKLDYGSLEDYQVYSNMWSDLRCNMITNVDDFVNTFLSTQLNECGEFLYNQDYDVKYISTNQINMLHGKRISFIKNWLLERITFLDSVFGYKTTNEDNYLKENSGSTAPYIAPYNIPWKNTAKIKHNSNALKMPVTTNSSVIMMTNIGNSSKTYTYVPKNTTTMIPVADNLATPNIQTTINNSDCITDMDLSTVDILGLAGMDGIAVTTLDNKPMYEGFESISELYNQFGSFASLKKLNLKNANISSDEKIDYFKLFKTWDSSPYGVSPEPFSLQELNLSGIKNAEVTANLSGIGIDYERVPSIYKAPFKKVTSVDISNSNISSVTIPTGVSLYNLNIANSQIKELQLIDQPLLAAPNFNGCINLAKITMINCGRFVNLTFNSTTKALQTLTISGCKNLESLIINGGSAYKYLPSIAIQNCPNLKKISITNCDSNDYSVNEERKVVLMDLPNLEQFSVSNSHYTTIEWDGVYAKNINTGETVAWDLDYAGKDGWERMGHTKLENLNVSNSSVSEIKGRYQSYAGGIDLKGFSSSNLKTVNFSNCANITEVHFNNNSREPFYINTNTAFARCENLTRVYGYIVLNANSVFLGSKKFSIHGTSDVKYNERDVLVANKWMHPDELGLLTCNVMDAPGNELAVVFQEGDKVTNLQLAGKDVSQSFMSTSCTTFDAYYSLMNVMPSVQNINKLFQASKVTFGWGSSYSNDPYRFMFTKCIYVTDAQLVFHECTCGGRLWSPYIDEYGNEIPGTLTPLKNIAGYNCMFNVGNGLVCDKNVFRTFDSNHFAWRFLQYFSPNTIVNDVNSQDFNYSAYTDIINNPTGETNMLNNGNLSGFLTDVPNLQGELFALFNGTRFINYDTLVDESLNIPINISTLRACFVTTYAKGELNFATLFQNNDASHLRNIYSSFMVSNVGGTTDKPVYLDMRLDESLFQSCVNLTNVGYVTEGDYSGGAGEAAFSGAGLRKIIGTMFPYNLLKGKDKLESFVGFFENCDMTSIQGDLILPGDLFTETPNIRNLARCFYNIKTNVPVKLSTDSPFRNCPNLSNVTAMFGHPAGKDDGKSAIRENPLPRKFFYTGGKNVVKSIQGTDHTYEVTGVSYMAGATIPTAYVTTKQPAVTNGTNSMGLATVTTTTYTREYNNYDSIEGNDNTIIVTPITNILDVETKVVVTTNSNGTTTTGAPVRKTTQYVDPSFMNNMKTYTFEYEELNKSINIMTECFRGADFKEYSYNYSGTYAEANPDYQPYKFVFENNVWKKGIQNNVRFTYEWVYDGDRTKYWNHVKLNKPTESETIDGHTYIYEQSLPDDAWLKDATNLEDMINEIPTNCNKATKNNWGKIGESEGFNGCGQNPSNFCLPPDIFRYSPSSVNINSMFYKCGLSTHMGNYPDRLEVFGIGSNDSVLAYGLKGRLCPYMLKPVPELTSLKNTFTGCSWLGGYKKNGLVYIIPESFFSYIKSSSLDLTGAFRYWSFPAGSSLNVFHFDKNIDGITLNVEEAFYRAYYLCTDFDGEQLEGSSSNPSQLQANASRISNVFTDEKVYVRGMKKCFMISTQTSGSFQDAYKPDQFVTFSNVFDAGRYDKQASNADEYVFCGYRFVTDGEKVGDSYPDMRFGTKTLRTDIERHNYDAWGDLNKVSTN